MHKRNVNGGKRKYIIFILIIDQQLQKSNNFFGINFNSYVKVFSTDLLDKFTIAKISEQLLERSSRHHHVLYNNLSTGIHRYYLLHHIL